MATLSKKDIIIDIDTFRKNKGHTAKNLEVSNRVFMVESQPELYDESMLATSFGLAYNRRCIMPIDDIVLESKHGRQTVRVGANEKRAEIQESIKHGWKLNTSPISVVFTGGNDSVEYKILEGRTRLGIIKDLGITGNVIVDVYEHIDPAINTIDFSAYCNGDEVSPPKGHTTEESAKMIIKDKMDSGELKADETLEKGASYKKLVKEIKLVIKKLGLPLKAKHAEEFAKDSVKINTSNIVEFSDKSATAYLLDKFGITNTATENYYVTSTDEWVASKEALKEYERMLADGEGHKELRIITNLETLDPGKGYENHWYLANYCVGAKAKKHLNTMIIATGGDPSKCKLSIWGTIPQCHSLENAFPMDQIVRYDTAPTIEQKKILASFSKEAKRKFGIK